MSSARRFFLGGVLVFCVGQTFAAQHEVSTQAFSELAFYPEHRASAHVLSLENSQVSAEITARIQAIPVHIGDVVEAQAILAELDCTDYRLNLQREKSQQKQLEAQLSLADYQLQRAKKLSKQQAVAQELLKQRETEVLVLQSKQDSQSVMIKQAKNNIEKCTVRTPYKAVVIEKLGQVGELANPGTAIVRIIDATRFEVVAKVQTHMVANIENTKSIVFRSAGIDYQLKKVSITPIIETRERTQEIRLEFIDKKPLPGAAGELVWFSETLHIPADYLVKRKGKFGLFLSENDRAKFLEIPHAVSGRSAPVNINKIKNIVTKGRYRLHDGDELIVR